MFNASKSSYISEKRHRLSLEIFIAAAAVTILAVVAILVHFFAHFGLPWVPLRQSR